jgi:hypothetical protein
MSIPRFDPNFKKSDLKKSADKLINAAYFYWEDAHRAGITGAVVWIKTSRGCAIFTRGEYWDQLLKNIEEIGPGIEFGASDEFP